MRPTEERPQDADARAPDPLFGEYDVVALVGPWPEGELDAGVWGNVLGVLEDGHYDVEFTDKDGTPLARGRVHEGLLTLVWADPG